MGPMTKRTLFLLAVTTVFPSHSFRYRTAAGCRTTNSGSLADGAKYLIEVPANWNGTLFLYSHGYVVPGTPNPLQDFAKDDPFTRFFMLSQGYALAGSSYATTGNGQSKTRCGITSAAKRLFGALYQRCTLQTDLRLEVGSGSSVGGYAPISVLGILAGGLLGGWAFRLLHM